MNGGGGGIISRNSATITNNTFSGNSATGAGGGILMQMGFMVVKNCTFHDNSAQIGRGIVFGSGTLTVTNSIFCQRQWCNCTGTPGTGPFFANGGYNISDDDSCDFNVGCPSQTCSAANGDTIGDNVSDANLNLDAAGLTDNGGPTQTIAFDLPSFAYNGATTNCPATDQRGVARPDNGSGDSSSDCDIGAFEFTATAATPTATATATATATNTADSDRHGHTDRNADGNCDADDHADGDGIDCVWKRSGWRHRDQEHHGKEYRRELAVHR